MHPEASGTKLCIDLALRTLCFLMHSIKSALSAVKNNNEYVLCFPTIFSVDPMISIKKIQVIELGFFLYQFEFGIYPEASGLRLMYIYHSLTLLASIFKKINNKMVNPQSPEPPYEKNGNGTPIVGKIPTTMAIFTKK